MRLLSGIRFSVEPSHLDGQGTACRQVRSGHFFTKTDSGSFTSSNHSLSRMQRPAPIEASPLYMSKEPEPELILGRNSDKKGLYFEAKASSFKAGTTIVKQARAHLLACGPAFAETLAPLQHALLCSSYPRKAVRR